MNKVLLPAIALMAMLALAGSASATTSFERVGAFNEAFPDGQPAHQHRIAVNQASGDVYVTDPINDVIAVSRPNGSGADPLTTFGSGLLTDPYGIAIDQSTGDVYVSDDDAVVKFTSNGASTPTFTEDNTFTSPATTGPLAFDQSDHQLLVADTATDHVRRYSSGGAVVADFDGTAGTGSPGAFTGLQDLAVGATGDIVIVDSTGNPALGDGVSRVERFASNGEWQATIGPVEQAATVAIRPEDDALIVSGDQNRVYSSGNPTLHLFAPDGDALGDLSIDPSLQYATVAGIAGDDGPTGQLFVATDNGDYNHGFDEYTYGYTSVQVYDPFVLAAATTGATSAITTTSVTLEGTVNPDGVDATYHFEYGPDTTYGSSTPESDSLTGSGAQAATADVTGLAPNTTYHYRLVATNASATSTGEDATFTTDAVAPTAVTTAASAITGQRARLNGSINPHNAATTYHFEYGQTTGYGSDTPQADAGSGGSPVDVARFINGLTAATTYHYRLVATNAKGTTLGGDRSFTTAAPTGAGGTTAPVAGPGETPGRGWLPDNRGWEQVSPVAKAGTDINGDATSAGSSGEARASVSGNAVAYSSFGVFAGAEGAAWPSWYRAVRRADGWSSSSLTPAAIAGGQPPANTAGVTALTDDLSKATVFTNAPLTSDAPPGVYNLFVQDNDSGAHALVTDLGPPASLLPAPPLQLGASADLRHVFFLSTENLTPTATGFGNKFYESVDGHVRLAGIGPEPGNEPLDGVFPGSARSADRMVSEDGSRAFFIGPDANLYVRENGDTTTRISASDAVGDSFYTATRDGSKVLHASQTVGSGGGIQTRLMLTDVVGGTTETLSDDEFFGVLKASDDLQYVYFLTGNTNGTTLWLWHDGDLRHIVDVPAGDALQSDVQTSQYAAPNNSVSPDGQTFLFVSGGRYTGYDNQGHREVYRYRPATGDIDCVSCTPSGAPPTGDAALVDWFFRSTNNLPATSLWNGPEPWHRWPNISADQRRIFFNSSEALVPEDVNGKIDVYGWEDGHLSLLSSGTGSEDARFMNASASGDDVFFVTRNRLVGSDRDDLVDLYDARVEGGFAEPGSTPPPCSSDACQGLPATLPSPPLAATLTFAGQGNLPVAPSGAAAPASVTVSNLKAVRGTTATVKVKVPGAGTVTVSGSLVRKVTKKATRAATYSVKVSLTTKAKATLRKRHSLPVKVKVSFKPKVGRAAAKSVTLSFRQPKGHR